LRDQLCARGWEQKCESGSELVLSPEKAHAIVVASGDENTGSLTDTPNMKCPKGTRMDEAANRNEMQMNFLALEATTADVIDGFEIRAWIDELRFFLRKQAIALAFGQGFTESGREVIPAPVHAFGVTALAGPANVSQAVD
jgi:hypothetical protein